MAQPVMDTLQVADELRRSGMEREQAEAFAHTLATQLSEHVVVRKDQELGFAGIRAHVDEQFAQVDKQFAQVDKQFAQVDKQLAELKSEIRGEIKGELRALDTKFNILGVGMGLALAYLAVLASLDRFL